MFKKNRVSGSSGHRLARVMPIIRENESLFFYFHLTEWSILMSTIHGVADRHRSNIRNNISMWCTKHTCIKGYRVSYRLDAANWGSCQRNKIIHRFRPMQSVFTHFNSRKKKTSRKYNEGITYLRNSNEKILGYFELNSFYWEKSTAGMF